MRAYKLEDISIIQKPVFFDANVLIYLFWPTGTKYYEENYAKAFNSLRKSGEVVNRVLRIEYKRYEDNYQKLKHFRNSDDGEEVLNDIYSLLEEVILPQFEITDRIFTKSEINDFLTYDDLDFNDKAIAEICRSEDLILLTNDSDFKDTDIEILSGHPTFFN